MNISAGQMPFKGGLNMPRQSRMPHASDPRDAPTSGGLAEHRFEGAFDMVSIAPPTPLYATPTGGVR